MNADEALKELELAHPLDLCTTAIAEVIEQQAARIAELEQQRGGVVLPERKDPEGYSKGSPDWHAAHAQNECLDEVARLNPPGECVAVPSRSAIEAAFDDACGSSGSAVPIGEPLYSISLSEVEQAIRALLAQQEG